MRRFRLSQVLSEHRFNSSSQQYEYTIRSTLETSGGKNQIFWFLEGLNLNQTDRVSLNFDSSIKVEAEGNFSIYFTCNQKIYNISFSVLVLSENPEEYEINIEEIAYGEDPKKPIPSQNVLQPFLGLVGMRGIEYQNGGFSLDLLPDLSRTVREDPDNYRYRYSNNQNVRINQLVVSPKRRACDGNQFLDGRICRRCDNSCAEGCQKSGPEGCSQVKPRYSSGDLNKKMLLKKV